MNIQKIMGGSIQVVNGGFDSFYQDKFRNQLESELKEVPYSNKGIVQPFESKQLKVVNWKKAAKI